MKRIVFLFIIFTFLLTGCTQYKKIEIENVTLKSFKFKGTSSAQIVGLITVDNPTKYTIALDEMEAALLKEGKTFITFELVETSSVAPFSEAKVEVKIDAKVADPLAIITTGLDFNNWNKEDFTLNGKLTISSNGKSKKTVKMKNIPLEKVLGYLN